MVGWKKVIITDIVAPFMELKEGVVETANPYCGDGDKLITNITNLLNLTKNQLILQKGQLDQK